MNKRPNAAPDLTVKLTRDGALTATEPGSPAPRLAVQVTDVPADPRERHLWLLRSRRDYARQWFPGEPQDATWWVSSTRWANAVSRRIDDVVAKAEARRSARG